MAMFYKCKTITMEPINDLIRFLSLESTCFALLSIAIFVIILLRFKRLGKLPYVLSSILSNIIALSLSVMLIILIAQHWQAVAKWAKECITQIDINQPGYAYRQPEAISRSPAAGDSLLWSHTSRERRRAKSNRGTTPHRRSPFDIPNKCTG
jgi:hypothetical protein